jgi:deoxyribose-phosphate aldolase
MVLLYRKNENASPPPVKAAGGVRTYEEVAMIQLCKANWNFSKADFRK